MFQSVVLRQFVLVMALLLTVNSSHAESPLAPLKRGKFDAYDTQGCDVWNLIKILQTDSSDRTLIAFSPDGKSLVSTGHRSLLLWTFGEAEPKKKLLLEMEPQTPRVLAISPDGKTLAVSSQERAPRLYDLPEGKLRAEVKFTGQPFWMTSLAFSPDGKSLALASGDQGICLFDTNTGEQRPRPVFKHPHPVHHVNFSPDGRSLLTGDVEGTLRLWELATGQERMVIRGPYGRVNALTMSADGKTLASGGGTTRLWDVFTGEERSVFRGHRGDLNTVAFSSSGKLLSAESGGWAYVFDSEGKKIRDWFFPRIDSAAWAPDGRHVAFGRDGRIYIMRLPD